MACGADQIAAMLSDVAGQVANLGLNLDDISGAVEDSGMVTETDQFSSTVSCIGKGAMYKSKEALTEAVRRKKEAIHRVFKMMQYAEEVDLCFLVDCTGSMGPYISRVKTNIKTWYDRLRANYKHLKLRVAFVRYTDFDQPKSTRTTWLDFTDNVGRFLSFVDAIGAPGGVGGDSAEDVFSGLEAIPKLAWREIGTKVLIHFADAPCHGRQYHNGCVDDDYPDGDPDKRDLNEIMSKLYRREIQYHFGFINESSTSKMVSEFDKILLERGGREMIIRTFDAQKPPLMDEAVYRSISTSISATLQKMSAVDKSKGKIREFELMKTVPEWDELTPHSVTVNSTLSSDTGTSVDRPSIPKSVKRAQQPFAKGGVRLAYHAYLDGKHVVMKEFLSTDDDQNCLKRFMETSVIHQTAAYYAREFNKDTPAELGVILEVASCGIMECPQDMDGKTRYYSFEPFINGDYTKFNSNNGYVALDSDPVNDTCQAFSHYTWVKSEEKLVVCDIQGVKKGSKVLLTDPAIHDKNVLLYGATNLGAKGIMKFFKTHRCNHICIKMGLKKSRHQL